MTPFYYCPVPQFPHLSNVPIAVPVHRTMGAVHSIDEKWGEARDGGRLKTQKCTTKPEAVPPQILIYTIGRGLLISRSGLAGSPSHAHPARRRARSAQVRASVMRRRQGFIPTGLRSLLLTGATTG